ncbi:MAG: DUF502 domain-containing protein [Alphaproteobacteria bacterium]
MGSESSSDTETSQTSSQKIAIRFAIWRGLFNARIRNYFLAGVLVTTPITVTAWISWQILQFFEGAARHLMPDAWYPKIAIPGAGLLIVFLGLIIIGALTAGLLGRIFLRTSERILNQMPIVRSVYSAIKQVLETVLAKRATAFRQVVLLEYPRKGIWAIGFVSGATKGEVAQKLNQPMVNVFLPTTPNPTSGFLLFVPKDGVQVLEMTIEEGIKLVVSGGIVSPKTSDAGQSEIL